MARTNHTWTFAHGPLDSGTWSGQDMCDVDALDYRKLLGARLVGMGKDPYLNFDTLILHHPELGYVCIKAEAYLAYGDPTGEFGVYHAVVDPEDGHVFDLEFLDTSTAKSEDGEAALGAVLTDSDLKDQIRDRIGEIRRSEYLKEAAEPDAPTRQQTMTQDAADERAMTLVEYLLTAADEDCWASYDLLRKSCSRSSSYHTGKAAAFRLSALWIAREVLNCPEYVEEIQKLLN